MPIQFPSNPVEGTFHNVTPEKKYRFTNGAWKLHINNQPLNELAPVPTFPPRVSDTAPDLEGDDTFWFDETDGILYFKQIVDNVPYWKETISGAARPADLVALAAAAEADATAKANAAQAAAEAYADVAIGSIDISEVAVQASTNTLDLATGDLFYKTISVPVTLGLNNVPSEPGRLVSFMLELTNGGSAAVTWWANIKWKGGVPPTLTAAGVDILGFYSRNNGATWHGFVLSTDSKGAA